MDPIILAIGIIVVVVHFTILVLLIRGSFTFHGEHLGTVTVSHSAPSCEQHTTESTQQEDLKVTTDSEVQTEDSDIFYTCYEHIEAQRQETLLAAETLDETVETFAASLHNIQEHLDKNFQFLTFQLRAEFDSYLHYALAVQAGQYAELPVPHNLDNPVCYQHQQIPDLVTAYYQPITEFENFEIKLANEDVERQSQGGRPLDKLRPWYKKPFGRKTRSQNSYLRRRTKQEEYIGRKRQEEYRQAQLVGAIQTVVSSHTSAQSLRPYAEYYTGFDTQDTVQDNVESTEPAPTDDNKEESQGASQPQHEGDDSVDNTPSLAPTPQQKPTELLRENPEIKYSARGLPLYESPIGKHYYYPRVPPPTIGRGEQRNLREWLKDNPDHTEANFYWLRQNEDQLPTYLPSSQDRNDTYVTDDEGQYQDAMQVNAKILL